MRKTVFGIALGVVGISAILAAFRLPFWQFILYAPQYPHGLRLSISLTGLAGDVHEIGMLNHYIGMQHLEDAAPFERAFAAYGVAAVVVSAALALFVASKRYGWLAAVPAALFPLGFVADCFYWLHRFGHSLDPHAPVHIPGFTPELFGNGQIGQFMTFAQPGVGFWLALAGAVFVLGGACVRRVRTRGVPAPTPAGDLADAQRESSPSPRKAA